MSVNLALGIILPSVSNTSNNFKKCHNSFVYASYVYHYDSISGYVMYYIVHYMQVIIELHVLCIKT